ncbi:UPF0158 family protein [Halomonas stenophila]|uniref:Uncharacterized protein n=1 Tax=Halomonas stenophila TaxID=795312 RepID=A0A7W5HLE5_9GAMM|nr:UPF0158 family protein [Halomonas stenophila]MBB3232780.1 hypothetical protein [Halomonas stenophila]
MPLPVSLKEVVEAMQPLSEEWQAFIHRHTGELVSFTEEEAQFAEEGAEDAPEWLEEFLPKVREVLDSEAYVQLPGQFDFHEYRVMEDFCRQQEDMELQHELLTAIRGRGAFRRFKDAIQIQGIAQDWYDYRDRALRELAADFLEVEGIPFVEE